MLPAPTGNQSFISTLAAALGFGLAQETSSEDAAPSGDNKIDFRELWERFQSGSEAEMPSDDQELLGVLSSAVTQAAGEWAPPRTVSAHHVAIRAS